MLRRPPALKLHHQNPFPPRAFRQLRKWPLSEGLGKAFFAPVKRLNGCDADRAVEVQRGGNVSLFPQFLLDSLAVGCRFEPAVGGTSEALRVAVLPIREGKCLPGVFAPNGQ